MIRTRKGPAGGSGKTDFIKLEAVFRRLFSEGRAAELLRTAFALLKHEKNSGAAVNFILFRLPGDTIFHSKTSAQSFTVEKAAIFYRLAELCRDKGAFWEMDKLLALYLSEGRDELTVFLALCLTGELCKAYALAPALFKKYPSAETFFFAADPWVNIHGTDRINAALSEVEAALAGLKGPAKELAAVHLFALSEKAGKKPPFKIPHMRKAAESVIYMPAAEIFLDRLEFGKAEALLRTADNAWPAYEGACGKLAEAMFCGGKREAAIGLLASRQSLINSPGFSAWRGQLLLFAGRYGESVKELTQAIADGNGLGWCWRGAALFKLGRNGPAMKDLDQALKTAPNDLEARVWRAELLRTGRKYAPALKDLAHVLSIMPGHPWALANLALLAAERGDRAGYTGHFLRLPQQVKLACEHAGGDPAALSGLLKKLKGIRRHEPRFFHTVITR